VDNANGPIDPELYNEAQVMNARQRIYLAEKFIRWAAQLTASARQMDPTVAKDDPATASKNN